MLWIAQKTGCVWYLRFLCGFYALFMGPASTYFNKKKIKTRSYGIIHTFKNYFATMFSVLLFLFK